MPNEFIIKNGFISKGNSIVEGGITTTTISASTYSNLPSPSITVGTSQLTSGTDTRVLFQSGTTLQQDGNFTFDPTLKRLTLKAVGTASTHIPFAVQSSVSSSNLFSIRGDQAIEMIATTPSTNGGILITKTDNYNSPRIQLYNVFAQLTDINGSTISTSNLKSGSSGAAGYMGIVNTTSQDRFLKFINLFGNETLSIGGNNYDGAATFTMKSWAGTSPGVIFNIVKSDNTNPFVITDTARVGIGTNSPQSRLDVRSQGSLSTDIAFRVRNSADSDNLIEIAGNGLIKFRTGTERIELNVSASDYKLSLYKFDVEMTKISTYASYFCYGGSGQYLGIGTNAPSHLLDIYSSVTPILTRWTNDENNLAGSDVTLKFTTRYTGGGSGGNPLAYLTVGGTGAGVNSNNRSYFKFLLSRANTLAERASITSQSNFLLQTPTEDTNDVGVIYVPNGTVPTSGITDGYKQYSADITAGNAAPHFRTENGSIVKLYQETTGVTTSTLISNVGTTITDTDTFDGYTLQQIVKALRNLGVLQ